MFINRNYRRTEADDYKLNVEKYLQEHKESLEVFHEDKLIGWKIIDQYD